MAARSSGNGAGHAQSAANGRDSNLKTAISVRIRERLKEAGFRSGEQQRCYVDQESSLSWRWRWRTGF